MRYKLLIVLILSYGLAFSINFMPAIKHPDTHMNILNLLVTILFMLLLLLYAKNGSKKLKLFSIIGVLSGVLVFVITTFEHAMLDNVFLNILASIQYPLYLIFITPLFGGNLLFDISYGSYSLWMSLFYGVVFVLMVTFKKKNTE